MVSREMRVTAAKMLEQLEASRLEVALAPSLWGEGMIRVVDGRNCRWYRQFCEAYTANRTRARRGKKHDTLIKRRCTIRALHELIDGKCETVYAHRLLPFVEAELHQPTTPHELWCQAFGL